MNIAIIGAAYTGMEAARYLKSLGHTISVTTTSERRVAELEPVSDRVVVMRGNNRERMSQLLSGQDAVLMTVAGGMVEKDGKFVMDLELYTDTYVGTAECLAECLDAAPQLSQVVFTGSWSVYGNAGGADDVNEDTPATPGSPFQQVYADTESILFNAATDTRNVCVYRTGTIYGPQVGFIPRQLRAQALPLAGQTVPFDGDSPATIVHRDDVVGALTFALDNHLSGIYNLVNDISESKSSFMGKFVAEAGVEPINWVGHGTGPKSLSNQKIKDAGFQFLDPRGEHDGESLL
ncbi:MAG: NAD-dependent epimerase/dehydratase family protein [Gammaproteobacteria bacterium]|jgi:nucleoside-diphosphate-sugar epimerase|nr:NAD(P)-dependent oxidoreductase [Chromatiales bacterium]MCP4927329.1 NAD-dependent epimerase/dehydratase family protein [Gammaproteobacteria bacterium]